MSISEDREVLIKNLLEAFNASIAATQTGDIAVAIMAHNYIQNVVEKWTLSDDPPPDSFISTITDIRTSFSLFEQIQRFRNDFSFKGQSS